MTADDEVDYLEAARQEHALRIYEGAGDTWLIGCSCGETFDATDDPADAELLFDPHRREIEQ